MSAKHPNPPVRRLRAEQPIQKAARLLREDRVSASRAARVYTVTGDSGTYRVIAEHDGIHCPCQARTPLCAHVLAVAQCASSERAELAREADSFDEYTLESFAMAQGVAL